MRLRCFFQDKNPISRSLRNIHAASTCHVHNLTWARRCSRSTGCIHTARCMQPLSSWRPGEAWRARGSRGLSPKAPDPKESQRARPQASCLCHNAGASKWLTALFRATPPSQRAPPLSRQEDRERPNAPVRASARRRWVVTGAFARPQCLEVERHSFLTSSLLIGSWPLCLHSRALCTVNASLKPCACPGALRHPGSQEGG